MVVLPYPVLLNLSTPFPTTSVLRTIVAVMSIAFALARPTTLFSFNNVKELSRTHPVVRRRPRIKCKSASYVNSNFPRNPAEFRQRAMRLARSLGVSNTTASQVEEELRRLNSFCAADLAFAELRGDIENIPDTWREILQILETAGVVSESLDRVIDRVGLCRILSIDPGHGAQVYEILSQQLKMPAGKLRRLIVRTPAILENSKSVETAVQFLRGIQLNDKDIQNIVVRWPDMLNIDVENAEAVLGLLRERVLRGNPRRFIVRAPFVLLYEVNKIVKPAFEWMRAEFADVEHIVRSCPLVLGNSVSQFRTVKSFLLSDVGIAKKEFAATIRSFPPLLVADETTILRPALRFLRVDLGFSRSDAAHVTTGFPSTLTLDVNEEMRKNVEYFRAKGIENVCRIVRRLPPILAYDLQRDIIPKMDYLETSLHLSPFDLLSFPAYFSYPLETRILPRTLFLRALGKPLLEVGLNMAISLNDDEFCNRVAERPLKDYQQFCNRVEELLTEKKRLRDKKLTQQRNPTIGVRLKFGEDAASGRGRENPIWSTIFSK